MNDITIKLTSLLMQNIIKYKYKKDKEKLSQVMVKPSNFCYVLYKMITSEVSKCFFKNF
mgnify:CR=1 FL=1